MLPKTAKASLGKPGVRDDQRVAPAQPLPANVKQLGTGTKPQVMQQRRLRVIDLLRLGPDQPGSGRHPAVDHELREAEELVEVLLHARLGDKTAHGLPRVDQPLILKLRERPANRSPRSAVLDRQLRL